MARQVYLAYTRSDSLSNPELLRIYSKSSYQDAYNWIADIAERYGNSQNHVGLRYPVVGDGKTVCSTTNPSNGQVWWLERHEVV